MNRKINVKHKIASMIITTFVGFSLFSSVLNAAPVEPHTGSITKESTADTAKKEYALVNDASNTFSIEQAKELETKLTSIQKQTKNDSSEVKIYSFIYKDGKSVDEVANGLISSYSGDKSVSPVIFIFNKENQDYCFVIDEHVSPFVAKGYLEWLIGQSLLPNKNFDAKTLENTILRFNTTIVSAYVTNASGQDQISFSGVNVQNKHFKNVDFNKKESKPNQKKQIDNGNPENEEGKNNNDVYILGGIILAIITGAIILFSKRKKVS